MNTTIRFRLPVVPGMKVDAWTPLGFIGQDTKVDGQPAIITDAVFRHDTDGSYLDIEAEVLPLVRQLNGPMAMDDFSSPTAKSCAMPAVLPPSGSWNGDGHASA